MGKSATMQPVEGAELLVVEGGLGHHHPHGGGGLGRFGGGVGGLIGSLAGGAINIGINITNNIAIIAGNIIQGGTGIFGVNQQAGS